jgi:hypothetical protein
MSDPHPMFMAALPAKGKGNKPMFLTCGNAPFMYFETPR